MWISIKKTTENCINAIKIKKEIVKIIIAEK